MRVHFDLTKGFYRGDFFDGDFPWIQEGFKKIDATDLFVPNDESYEIQFNEEYIFNFLNIIAKKNKLLAIYDSNRAHHFSYFLAKRALDIMPFNCSQADYLVLNIDQHEDYRYNQSLINCGNWGFFIHKASKCNYISCCNKSRNKLGIICKKKSINGILSIMTPETITDTLNEFFTKNKKYIYISIDLDVLPGQNRTEYPEGILQLSELLDMLHKISEFIKENNVEIIGADVNGLTQYEEKYYSYTMDTLLIINTLNFICCPNHIPR